MQALGENDTFAEIVPQSHHHDSLWFVRVLVGGREAFNHEGYSGRIVSNSI